MNIKIIFDKSVEFTFKRLAELTGLLLISGSILLFISLISYSPEDPNFIFPKNTEINNFLGSKGSYASDLFYQSIGLISVLVPITIFFTGFNVFIKKKFLIIILNIFFVILYSILGSLFFSVFHTETFWLTINGNNGFVGNLFEDSFFIKIIKINEQVSYYILIIVISIIFLLSINFKLKTFISIIKKIFFLTRKNKNSFNTLDQKIEEEIIPNESYVETRVQENFSFDKNKENKSFKFKLPSLDFLKKPTKKERESIADNKIDDATLEKILLDFGVEGKIKKISHGPVVTLNEFEPAPGVKVSKIINLSEDIARNTSSESARISTIPGRNTVGIELPNSSRENVYLSEILSHNDFSKKEIRLPIALGKNISGNPIIGDLASMPHLLIAGTTGSGKSVGLNSMILSLLYKLKPSECRFILIDPKMLEFSVYEDIPHLMAPVVTDPHKAVVSLKWAVKEMENRYRLMNYAGVKNIKSYNEKINEYLQKGKKLYREVTTGLDPDTRLPVVEKQEIPNETFPYIVIVIDEMADLMMVAGKDVEQAIQRLAQMARAAGIHLIMATQRPSVDVITGTIKANFPTRISFQVTSKIDSRTILGEQGAEQLLGKGDMLYMSSANKIVRIHAPFVSDNEIEKINDYLRTQAEPDYVDEILNFADEKEIHEGSKNLSDKDELYQTAVEIIKSEGKASTSFLQRKLQIGYNRAARIIDMMETEGIVSKANHVGKRDVL